MYEFFRFELKYRLRQPSLYLFALLFGLLTFGATTTDAVQIGGSFGQTAVDAPYVVIQFLSIMSVTAVFVVVAFTATTVLRDFDQGTYDLFYTKPIGKTAFVLGRFLGGTAASTLVMVGAALGLVIGRLMPWIEPDRLVGFRPEAYLSGFGLMVIPNLIIMGAIFFSLAALTRRMLWAYVGVVGFFVLYGVAGSFISDLDNDVVAALSEPFGLRAFSHTSRYWTPAERNTLVIPIDGVVALNRAIWLTFSGIVLALTVKRIRLQAPSHGRTTKQPVGRLEASRKDAEVPKPRLDFTARGHRLQWLHQLRVEIRGVLRSTPFLVLGFFTVVNTLASAMGTADEFYGTPVYPVTHLMLRVLDGSLALFLLIVVTFYAGELVWRERKSNMAEVFWALPVPNWVVMTSKLVALLSAVTVLSLIGVLTAVSVQLMGGYTRLEAGLYAADVFGVSLGYWVLVSVLAFFFQVVANHRFIGYGLVALYFVSQLALPAMGLEHDMYLYASGPSARYSDMNGYGHFLGPSLLFRAYWLWAAAILLLIANLFWVRSTDQRLRFRIRGARSRITKTNTAMLALVTLGMLATGGWTFYNTNVLADYKTSDEQLDELQRYEEEYKQYEDLPQPRLIATSVEADVFPDKRRLEIRGVHRLRNTTTKSIDRLHVQVDVDVEIRELGLPAEALEHFDEHLGYRIYRLEPPLAPGAEMDFRFDLAFEEAGIPLGGSSTSIVGNGTFFHNTSGFVPHFGYSKNFEIADPNERKERGLPERPRMSKLEDEAAHYDTYISGEADWIEFDATVSTRGDQIALAPGYLVDSWEKDGRKYYRYESESKILNLWAIMSAKYEVKRDTWNDVGIEVYYHQPHEYNVERMIYAIKKSLDYYTEHFSPYQHRQIRIVEFPRYASYAQSLPNIIPYSESIGFIADLRDEEEIDYVFYVTAHEIAHQWWAHQVIGADVQGGTLMSETLAQYSALMVMEQEYGRAKMRKFLEHELNQYLRGRTGESDRELPLLRVENQSYIHYNKGSLAMYALREYAGEDVVNAALAKYLRERAFQDPPYTTSREFIDRLYEATSPEHHDLIEDYFEKIVLYDNRTVRAQAKQTDTGRWAVTLEVQSVKYEADDSGAETEVEMSDWIEIGVFGEDDDGEEIELLRQRKLLRSGTSLLEFEVDTKPVRAGIDPTVLLVDRNPGDNLRPVQID